MAVLALENASGEWLDKNLDFAPIVEDFAPHGFALIGGRLDYLDHRQVAALGMSCRMPDTR